jgi:hypothetical protein
LEKLCSYILIFLSSLFGFLWIFPLSIGEFKTLKGCTLRGGAKIGPPRSRDGHRSQQQPDPIAITMQENSDADQGDAVIMQSQQ